MSKIIFQQQKKKKYRVVKNIYRYTRYFKWTLSIMSRGTHILVNFTYILYNKQ